MSGTKGIVWTLALVFIVAAGSKFLDVGGNVFGLDGGAAQTIVNAGIAAVVAFAINYLSPMVDRYGIGSKE